MDTAPGPFLYKYFEPADRFVRIRIWGAAPPPVEPEALDRAGYRQAIVSACVDEPEVLETLSDDAASWERLSALVFDVNPELDVENVSIPAAGAPRPATATKTKRDARWRRRTRGLGERLRQRIVGQDGAVDAVVATVRRAAAGLGDGRGPLGSLLFVGPTGTGKTELARALADEMGEDALIRIDCSELGEAHEYAKLIGAPPGYVGHNEGGFLTEAITRNPNAVVLFDEVEKAHPRLAHLLLQVLDEGRLTDGRGQTADFRKAFVILTSNAGTRELEDARSGLGFVRDESASNDDTAREIVERALDRVFEPEFMGRLDEIVRFDDLTREHVVRIAEQALTDTAVRVRKRGARVRISSAVARWVAERGFSERGGARGIAAVIRREIEVPLADALLDGPGGKRAGWLHVAIRDGKPRVRRED